MKIKIETPCKESWENMHITPKGRFCDSCQKEVIDFSKFTDAELKEYFADKNKQGNHCGNFRIDQLNKDFKDTKKPIFLVKWWFSLLLFLGACSEENKPKTKNHIEQNIKNKETKDKEKFSSFLELKQDVTIKGLLLLVFKQKPLQNAKVQIKNTEFITYTKEDGTFELKATLTPELQDSITLEFSKEYFETSVYHLHHKDFDKTNTYHIEYNEEYLRKGDYTIIKPTPKNNIWQKIYNFCFFQKENPKKNIS